MDNFKAFGLPQPLMQSLERLQFKAPTPIQTLTIPVALDGKDILGSAKTGTGKTAAFSIPLIAKLMHDEKAKALVVAPTRELASQVLQAIKDLLGKNSKIRTALLIGGESMTKQLNDLRHQPRIFVGTPGRINDHLRRGLKLNEVNYLVLDETDRMLDMGFSIQIEEILKHLQKERQTLLLSATLPKNIVKLAESYLKDPERIDVGMGLHDTSKIKHDVLHIKDSEKHNELLDQLNSRTGSIIIFVKTKFGADKLAKKLRFEGHKAEAIHGDLHQNKRGRIISAFRAEKYRILVATDVAARGLDIPHIEHVINFDLPQCPEDYIHRIGRTARAGATGEAICFVTPGDKRKWYLIDRLLNPSAERPKEDRPRGDKSGGDKSRRNRRRPGNKPGGKPEHKPGGRPDHKPARKAGGKAAHKPGGQKPDNKSGKKEQPSSPPKKKGGFLKRKFFSRSKKQKTD